MMKNQKHMSRTFLFLMMVILLFALSACGKSKDTSDTETQRTSQMVTEGSNGGTDKDASNTTSGNDDAKILIAYFTAAENSGVDAISSAS
ncbi:MAG: hypothetical protein K2N63_07830, partial [Lachnospiraceae bacterium]|nr:hypothetical protein [Lachnospiraceae bacterium]